MRISSIHLASLTKKSQDVEATTQNESPAQSQCVRVVNLSVGNGPSVGTPSVGTPASWYAHHRSETLGGPIG